MGLDITMCPGGACPTRQRCYRYRAVTEGRQDYFGAPPFDPATGDQLWDIAKLEPTDEEVRVRAYYLWVAAGRPEGGQSGDHWQAARSALLEARSKLLANDLP